MTTFHLRVPQIIANFDNSFFSVRRRVVALHTPVITGVQVCVHPRRFVSEVFGCLGPILWFRYLPFYDVGFLPTSRSTAIEPVGGERA